MRTFALCLLLGLFFQPIGVFAQQEATDSTRSDMPRRIILPGGYIEKMNYYVIARLSYINNVERFDVKGDGFEYEIYPNTPSKLQLNLNYSFLSVGISFIPQFISSNDDDLEKGKTKGFGFTTQFNLNHWFQSLSYGHVQGFYLNNTADFDQDWSPGDPYVQFPDLYYRNFQGITGYNFNPNFSLKSLVSGTERQLKSAGTFLAYLVYRFYKIDNREEIQPGRTTQKSNIIEVIPSAGYYYNWVFAPSFYLSGGGSLGYGWNNIKLTARTLDETFVNTQNNGLFRWEAKGGVGYNGPRFFSGVYFSAENNKFDQESVAVSNRDWRIFTQVHVGYRLGAPKFLKDRVDKLSNLTSH